MVEYHKYRIGLASTQETESVDVLRLSYRLLAYVTTDQCIFIAILIYRLGIWRRCQAMWFNFAAFAAFVGKCLLTILSIVLYNLEDDLEGPWRSWKVVYPPLVTVAFLWQIHTIYILGRLEHKCSKNVDLRGGDENTRSCEESSELESRPKSSNTTSVGDVELSHVTD